MSLLIDLIYDRPKRREREAICLLVYSPPLLRGKRKGIMREAGAHSVQHASRAAKVASRILKEKREKSLAPSSTGSKPLDPTEGGKKGGRTAMSAPRTFVPLKRKGKKGGGD